MGWPAVLELSLRRPGGPEDWSKRQSAYTVQGRSWREAWSQLIPQGDRGSLLRIHRCEDGPGRSAPGDTGHLLRIHRCEDGSGCRATKDRDPYDLLRKPDTSESRRPGQRQCRRVSDLERCQWWLALRGFVLWGDVHSALHVRGLVRRATVGREVYLACDRRWPGVFSVLDHHSQQLDGRSVRRGRQLQSPGAPVTSASTRSCRSWPGRRV